MKIRTPLLSSRRGRRGRTSFIDYRTPPGGLTQITAGSADDDERHGPPGSITPEAQRKIKEGLAEGIARYNAGTPGDERSVTDAIARIPDPDWAIPVPAAQVEAVRSASGPQPALRDFPGGALPAEDVPQSWPRGENPYPAGPVPASCPPPSGPRPTFTPRPPAGPRPVIFEQVAAAVPVSKLTPPPPPAPPGRSAALYCDPGWAAQLMRLRVRNGEWDELPAIVEQGFGRNAADEAAGLRHSRASIAEGVVQQCAAIGRPDLAAPLLYRTHELTVAARAAAAEGGAP